jgi:hypothetical protein
VCQRAIEPGEKQVAGRGLPRRLRRYEGQPLHLRCHGEWGDVAVPQKAARPAAPPAARPRDTAPALLFAEDLALRFGISRWRARRLLVALERQHGPTVVGRAPGRRGPRRYTTEAALRAVTPRMADEDTEVVANLAARVMALEEKSA